MIDDKNQIFLGEPSPICFFSVFRMYYHSYVGPAYIDNNGCKFYYINYNNHRENGPAKFNPNGTVTYSLNNTDIK